MKISFFYLYYFDDAEAGVALGIFRRGADSSNDGAQIWFSGYYKCQKSPKNCFSSSDGEASMLRWVRAIAPGATPEI